MTVIRYRGTSNVRIIDSATLASFGFAGLPTLTWNQANGFEIDVDATLAAFLLAQGSDFEPGDPNDTFASLMVGSGQSLGSLKNIVGMTIGASTATFSFVPPLSRTIEVGAKPITVTYGCKLAHTVTGGTLFLMLYEDGVKVDEVNYSVYTAAGVALGSYIQRAIELTPAAGAHTYEVKTRQATATDTAHFIANATSPAILQIRNS